MQILKILTVIICILPILAQADGAQINIYGTLIEPPACTINNGSAIPVLFGDNIGISRVDGVNYTRTIDYQIHCENDPDNTPWVMGLTVVGTPTSFSNAAVQTKIDGSSSTDLGIKMSLDGQDMKLNQRIEIKQSLPVLTAVPLKAPGSTLPEGYFHATATLLADYE